MQLRHLDLFSGIGGFALAMRWLGHETVGFCEIDPWCRKVLDKHWPEVPKHDDIKTLKGTDYGAIDIITGGFPCQPFSVAGKRRGRDDDRHLWPEMLRVIAEARPRFILGENVAGIIKMELDPISSDLEALGYTVGSVVIPAGGVNALHKRERLWIMAYADHTERREGMAEGRGNAGEQRLSPEWPEGAGSPASPRGTADTERMADADEPRLEGHGQLHAATREAQAPSFGSSGSVPDPERERQSGPWPREHASNTAAHREGEAGDVEHAGAAGSRGEAARPMGLGIDGLSPELVRSRWADGSWEVDLPRVVTHEPERKQKLQAAGNAIVPQVAYEVLKVMIGEAG